MFLNVHLPVFMSACLCCLPSLYLFVWVVCPSLCTFVCVVCRLYICLSVLFVSLYVCLAVLFVRLYVCLPVLLRNSTQNWYVMIRIYGNIIMKIPCKAGCTQNYAHYFGKRKIWEKMTNLNIFLYSAPFPDSRPSVANLARALKTFGSRCASEREALRFTRALAPGLEKVFTLALSFWVFSEKRCFILSK